MWDARLFDTLDYVGQSARKSHRPFGGLQLILTGDFYQLPPVFKTPNTRNGFCFQRYAWVVGRAVGRF